MLFVSILELNRFVAVSGNQDVLSNRVNLLSRISFLKTFNGKIATVFLVIIQRSFSAAVLESLLLYYAGKNEHNVKRGGNKSR